MTAEPEDEEPAAGDPGSAGDSPASDEHTQMGAALDGIEAALDDAAAAIARMS